ncbi:epoxide hydrolase N-terminal domain-containing protein [Rhodococcus sp. RS1C4]|nr:epoxide hydrolase N-terminal domain-containing protein [Rhodococcus sp. RS1C4]
MDISDFTIDVPQTDLDDLTARLTRTRFPNGHATGWGTGTDLDTMRRLTSYWAQDYDWRRVEARLNEFPHHLADGTLHFIHARSDRPDARPILLLHGWADSFAKYVGLIDALRNPVNADAPAFTGWCRPCPDSGSPNSCPTATRVRRPRPHRSSR